MSFPSLYDLVFREMILSIWQSDNLMDVLFEQMSNYTATVERHRYVPQVSYCHKRLQTLRKFLDKLEKKQKLPTILKSKLTAAFYDLTKEIREFAQSLLRNLLSPKGKNFIFCLKRIVFNPNCSIDKCQTIKKILIDSKFKIIFCFSLLGHYCIDPTFFLSRKRRHDGTVKEQAHIDVNIMKYWQEEYIRMSNTQHIDTDVIGKCLYAAASKSIEALRFFYNHLDPARQQSDLQDVAEFVLEYYYTCVHINADIVMFFYQNLEPERKFLILNRYFKRVFSHMLSSWRYRAYCIKAYDEMKDNLSPETFGEVFSEMHFQCVVYNYEDIMRLMKNIWSIALPNHKEHRNVAYCSIPSVVMQRNDFELLCDLLRGYSQEMQPKVITKLVECMIKNNRLFMIHECLEVMKSNGFDTDEAEAVFDAVFSEASADENENDDNELHASGEE